MLSNRPLTTQTYFNNNSVRTFGLRKVNQRRRNRLIVIYKRLNNHGTLNRIRNLPQQSTNNPLINQFFNGFSF